MGKEKYLECNQISKVVCPWATKSLKNIIPLVDDLHEKYEINLYANLSLIFYYDINCYRTDVIIYLLPNQLVAFLI